MAAGQQAPLSLASLDSQLRPLARAPYYSSGIDILRILRFERYIDRSLELDIGDTMTPLERITEQVHQNGDHSMQNTSRL